MKFIHTADWQIGMKAALAGSKAERVREERLLAAKRVVQAAKDHGVEFMLLVGDTFEDNGVDRLQVQKVVDILASFGRPVYVIPGNHDPLVPGSVWEHAAWSDASTIHILRDAAPVDIPGGILYPCPLWEKYSMADPTGWIPTDRNGKIRIGMAHGTVEGGNIEGTDFPIARNAAERCGLDYLALGHWHSYTSYENTDRQVRMTYSGTHEQTSFGERDSGNVLLVTIASPTTPPEIQPIKTGGMTWLSLKREFRSNEDILALKGALDQISDPGRTLIDLSLSGGLGMADWSEIERLKEVVEARFLVNRIDTQAIYPLPEDESWLAELPAGIIRDLAQDLHKWSDPVHVGSRPQNVSPELATLALRELYLFNKEASR